MSADMAIRRDIRGFVRKNAGLAGVEPRLARSTCTGTGEPGSN
jgi:hypothetical protein